jgi:hypothetical protein
MTRHEHCGITSPQNAGSKEEGKRGLLVSPFLSIVQFAEFLACVPIDGRCDASLCPETNATFPFPSQLPFSSGSTKSSEIDT